MFATERRSSRRPEHHDFFEVARFFTGVAEDDVFGGVRVDFFAAEDDFADVPAGGFDAVRAVALVGADAGRALPPNIPAAP